MLQGVTPPARQRVFGTAVVTVVCITDLVVCQVSPRKIRGLNLATVMSVTRGADFLARQYHSREAFGSVETGKRRSPSAGEAKGEKRSWDKTKVQWSDHDILCTSDSSFEPEVGAVSETDSAKIPANGARSSVHSLQGHSHRGRLLIHYRKRAHEVRVVAQSATEPARKVLTDIAAMYEMLAEDIAADID